MTLSSWTMVKTCWLRPHCSPEGETFTASMMDLMREHPGVAMALVMVIIFGLEGVYVGVDL